MNESLRKQFPILSRDINGHQLVYLDNAATTQKPKKVLEAMNDFYKEHNANIHRGIHTLAAEATNLWLDAHKRAATFINAQSEEEIIFTRNATEGINLIANTVGKQIVEEGGVIAISEMEHHSNIVPWQLIGARIEWIPMLPDFTIDLEYLNFLTKKYKEQLKLISIVHISNVLGCKNDVAKVTEMAKKYCTAVLVDAAQSVQHVKVDVQQIGCDFLVFSGHKLYGPTGTGVLYMKKEWGEKLEPWMGGGEMISSVKKTGATWNDLPWKFEAGTPNIAGGVGLDAAISWFSDQFEYDSLHNHESKLVKTAMLGMKGIKSLKIFGSEDPEQHYGVVAFSIDGIHPHDIAGALDERGIAIRAGYHCAEPLHERYGFGPTARISVAPYNSLDEIRYFIDSLKEVVGQFS
ncbi:MAG: SufS family cysteine desulfurase [Candidatus Dojkabacteria bacterium]|nr:MAG: SufS family cysteine desulfurase [Candidatus Dojkabacteria bacterium]